MSKARRNFLEGSLFVTLAVLAIVLVVGDPFSDASEAPPRTIVLEAKDLTFGGDNPTIEGKPGERLRIVVRNTDPGILHSISLPGLAPEVRHVRWGEEVTLEVTLPRQGSFEYVCPQHTPKMKGKIVVRP